MVVEGDKKHVKCT